MILRDKVTRQHDGAEVRAQVGSRSMASARSETDLGPIYWDLSEQLAALVDPKKGPWSIGDKLEWRGRQYVVTQVAIRRRGARDHHYTLTIETE